MLVAAPICPGDAHQLEGGGVNLSGILDVRAPAKVDETGVAVDRNLRLHIQGIAVLVEATLLQALDQLNLIRLIVKYAPRFISRDYLFFKGVLLGNDLAHALLDHLQVFRGQGARQVKIIVEAIFNRWTDGVLGLRQHFHHRLSHHVSRRMADAV